MGKVKNILVLLLVLGAFSLSGQFGVRGKIITNDFGSNSENGLLDPSIEIGIDYWFRLKNQRIEILPELSYERVTDNISGANVSFESINFYANTNIYFLDLYNDCDCPTFSKDGNAFTKGIHLILSPGVRYYSFKDPGNSADKKLAFSGGAGIGIDIGINDLLTVTPMAMYRYNPGLSWDGTADTLLTTVESFKLSQFLFGLRIGFRPDYVKSRFGR